LGVGVANSVIDPDIFMRPILLAVFSAKTRVPLTLLLANTVDPLRAVPPVLMKLPTIPTGPLAAVGRGNSLRMVPPVLMTPILLPPNSVNQRLPSGPAAMRIGPLLLVGTGNSLTAPVLMLTLPILFPVNSVNQILPSEPTAIPSGVLTEVGVSK
jgi:hypothetical protein